MHHPSRLEWHLLLQGQKVFLHGLREPVVAAADAAAPEALCPAVIQNLATNTRQRALMTRRERGLLPVPRSAFFGGVDSRDASGVLRWLGPRSDLSAAACGG